MEYPAPCPSMRALQSPMPCSALMLQAETSQSTFSSFYERLVTYSTRLLKWRCVGGRGEGGANLPTLTRVALCLPQTRQIVRKMKEDTGYVAFQPSKEEESFEKDKKAVAYILPDGSDMVVRAFPPTNNCDVCHPSF